MDCAGEGGALAGEGLSSLAGLFSHPPGNPAMNRRAIVFRPGGLRKDRRAIVFRRGGLRKGGTSLAHDRVVLGAGAEEDVASENGGGHGFFVMTGLQDGQG